MKFHSACPGSSEAIPTNLLLCTSSRHIWPRAVKNACENWNAYPKLWISPDLNVKELKLFFPDCHFFDYELSKLFETPYSATTSDLSRSKISELITPSLLSNCQKLLDRADDRGILRRIDRESIIYSCIIWSMSQINGKKIDLAIFGESPHNLFTYCLYYICQMMGVPCYVYGQWAIAPVMYIQRNLTDELIPQRLVHDRGIEEMICAKIIEYSRSFDHSKNNVTVPDYMLWQARRSKRISERRRKGLLQRTKRYLDELISFSISVDPFGSRKNARFVERLLLPIANRIIPNQNSRLLALQRAEKNEASSWLPAKYAYFALNYEPERTTLPDGGVYHDQLLALLRLREALPEDIVICVKEHPSQLNERLYGFRGRSPLFYRTISNLEGVHLVSHEFQSRDLLMNATFVVTISGTVALEAALSGRRALIFGHSWFSGCPNVWRFDNDIDFNVLLSSDVVSQDRVEKWMSERFSSFGVVGYQNPSGSRYFKDFELYSNFEKLCQVELQGSLDSVLNDFISSRAVKY